MPEQNYTSYNTSYGFSPYRPADPDRARLRSCGSLLGLAMLLHFLIIACYRFFVTPLYYTLGLLPFGDTAVDNIQTAIGIVVYLVAFLIPLFVYRGLIHIPFPVAFPLRPVRRSTSAAAVPLALGVTVVGSFAAMSVSQLLWMLGLEAVSPEYPVPHDAVGLLLFVLNLVVLPPLVEEFFFRGVLLQSLRRFGDGFALLASSVLFGLMHTYPDQIPYAFLAGLVIGFFVMRTGSLRIGILIHAVNNSISAVFSILYEFLPAGPLDLATYILYALYILSAIFAFGYLLRRDPQFFRLNPPTGSLSCGSCMRILFTSVPMLMVLALFAWETLRTFQ